MPGARPRRFGNIVHLPRPLGVEAALRRDLCGELERFGWIWWTSPDSRKEQAGITDVVAVHPRTGTVLFWELKSETGRLSKTKVVLSKRARGVRAYIRRGQTEWRDALTKSMQRSGGVVDYRIVRPSSYRVALDFLIAEHNRP